MKLLWPILLTILIVSAFGFPIIYDECLKGKTDDDFFFGVSFGGKNASEAKLLIDKVKGYTNFFLINSWDISINETALNEICEYAVNAEMNFIVFFDFIGYGPYSWHFTWLDKAMERWESKFSGIYLYDEPGGRQIDEGRWDRWGYLTRIFKNASDYSDAANLFVTSISDTDNMQNVKNRSIPVFTSDYALYWFDYLAGYDTVFVEFGWNHSRIQQIALGRGAANVQGKDWGAIITWTYENPPYLENGTKTLQDMITAYRAGAKYVILFNFPYDQPFGILEEEHFTAMKTFWSMARSPQQNSLEKVEGDVAFVLPKDYGWGMRTPNDSIWLPDWGPDNQSPLIWENMNKMIDKYGLRLDIIYNDTRFDFEEKYSEIYYWNSIID